MINMVSCEKKLRTLMLAVFLVVTLLVSILAANIVSVSGAVTPTASPPPIVWQREFMGGNGSSIYQLRDGGYIFNAVNESATFLVRVDGLGNLELTKTIKIGQKPTVLPYFVKASDGGYAFAGVLDNMYALVKTDSEGNLLWNKTYISDTPITYMRAMIETSDGGFALAGFGQMVFEGEGWSWFARTDASGNLLWNETLSRPFLDCPSAIIQEPDGGFTLSDVIFSLEPNYAFFRLVRTDQNGKVLWSQTYGDEDKYRVPECNTVAATNEGGYLIAGWLVGRNAWVVKTDAVGKMLWNQTYGERNSAVVCVQQTKDCGYILAAVQNVTDAWILKTDSTGNKAWNITFTGATFYGELEANYNFVIQTKDGGFVVLGTKDGNVWLAKLVYPERNPLGLPQVQVAIAVAVIALAALFGFSLIKRWSKRKSI